MRGSVLVHPGTCGDASTYDRWVMHACTRGLGWPARGVARASSKGGADARVSMQRDVFFFFFLHILDG